MHWSGWAYSEVASIDLRPTALKEFILANREVLLAEARCLDAVPYRRVGQVL